MWFVVTLNNSFLLINTMQGTRATIAMCSTLQQAWWAHTDDYSQTKQIASCLHSYNYVVVRIDDLS